MPPTEITPRAFFALRTDVRQNAHYVTDFQIIFPAGSVMILQNHYEKRQRLINLHEKSNFLECIVISPSRKLIAIIQNGERGQIIVYDLQSLKKKRTLNLPPDSLTNRFEIISFTHDDIFIIAITGEPDWNLVLYNWEKGKLTSSTKAINTSNPATVVQICCSPTDNAEICLVGQGLFRLLSRMETVWRQYGFQKADQINITSATWLTNHRIACGTIDGKLFIVEHGDLKTIFNAFTVNTVSVNEKDEASMAGSSSLLLVKTTSEGQEYEDVAVRALISFSKGFAFSCKPGYVHMFEKDGPHKYKKRNVFRIADIDLEHLPQSQLNIINHMSINVSEDKLLATTNRAQLYTVRLWGPDINVAPEIPFKHLGEPLHHGPVNGLSMCMWKPFFATSGGVDRTIRLWNYETETIQFVKHYSEEILTIDLHPTGNFIVVGFHDRVDFATVLMNDIQPLRSVGVKECQIIHFSAYGHYFALANGEVIEIMGTTLLNNFISLKGHIGKVNGFQWILDDKQLASCSSSGEIFMWDIVNGTIIGEVRMPDYVFWDIAVSSDGATIFAVDSEGVLNKFSNTNLSMAITFPHIPLEKVLLSRSNVTMFLTGKNSGVLSVKMPLTDPPEFSEYLYHASRIMQLKLSYDDQTLVTISNRGAIIVWKINMGEGKMLPVDKTFTYSTEILINKIELEKKIMTIKELSRKLHDLELGQMKEMRDTEAAFCEKIKEMHENYTHTIRDFKDKIELLETDQSKELLNLKSEIDELKEKQKNDKEELIVSYSNKLLVEYEKVRSLESFNEEMIADYGKKVSELERSKERETDELVRDYEEKLALVNALLQQTYEENAKRAIEHNAIKKNIEDDADREIIETTAKYEGLLKEEKERNITLKEETVIMSKKFAEAQKERDGVRHKLDKLNKDLQKFQTNIHSLENYLTDLKAEIVDRDTAIEEKDQKIFVLKKRIQESDKFKFVLEYKIKELRKEIDPKEREIEEKKEQIADMEVEMVNLKKLNSSLELQLVELKEKINGTEKDIAAYEKRHHSGVIAMRQIRVDIYTLYQDLADFKKLKDGIKDLNYKYYECGIDESEQFGESDIQRSLLVKRTFLEKTIKSLKSTLEKNIKNKPDRSKVIRDNVMLLEELNSVRRELTNANTKVKNMEKLIGAKRSKPLVPSEAFRKLQEALQKQGDIKRTYQKVIDGANLETENLKGKVKIMQDKLLTLCHSEDN